VSNVSAEPARSGWYPDGIERRLASSIGVIVAVSLAAAFVLRGMAALGTYLNPDEALHYVLVNQDSLAAAYRASLTNAHPPLYFVLLYYWRFVGNSELMLRLPSILASTAACWMAFRWIALALGRTAGLAGLLLMAFSPALTALGAEVRAYSVLLFCMAAALYFLERAFQDQQVSSIIYSSLFLYLAILTHYSALWFVLAAGIYALLRIRALSGKLRAIWALFQAGGAAIYGWLYVAHISKLRGSPLESAAITGWLRGVYFHRGAASPASFLRNASVGLFQFLFATNAGSFTLLLFIAGLLWMLTAGVLKKRFDLAAFGMLLILPFVLNFGGSLLDVYPYGGTRHCVYLVLFATAGVSFLVAQAVGQKLLPVLILAALLTPFWYRHRRSDPQEMSRDHQRKEWMTDALTYLHAEVPPGQRLFSNLQTSIILAYYLGRDQVPAPAVECGGLAETSYGPYRVVALNDWSVAPAEMAAALNRWRSACSAPPNYAFWVFDAGWSFDLVGGFRHASPQSVSEARSFGEATSLFKLSLH
jgi:hypothetical protein